MGQKLYDQDEQGGFAFKSERKAWGVDIPAYVYDLWMPLLGSDSLGVLGVYYRLAREDKIYRITLKELATACRIGTGKLTKINTMLAECKFIKLEKPEGWQRAAHYTTVIHVFDAPSVVSSRAIIKYAILSGYKPLSHWLVEKSENPNGTSIGKPKQVLEKTQIGSPSIEPLTIAPSIEPLKESAPNGASSRKLTKEESSLRYDLATVYMRWYTGQEPSKNEIVAAIGKDAQGTIGVWFRRAYEDSPAKVTLANFQAFLEDYQKKNPELAKLSKPDTMTKQWALFAPSANGGSVHKVEFIFGDETSPDFIIQYRENGISTRQAQGVEAVKFLDEHCKDWRNEREKYQ